jgi:membrane-associated protease RseP (regulator of RpoE activity)
MSAPKRLFSGGWQDESAALSDELAALRAQPRDPEPEPEPPRPERTPRRRRRLGHSARRVLPAAVVLLLILAGGAYALTAVLGPEKQPATVAAEHPVAPVYWLGMQIDSVPPASAVIETVALGSPAEAAGLDPGDVVVAVNGKPVSASTDIANTISGVHPGDAVEIQVNRGSTQLTTSLPMTALPGNRP